MKKYLNVGTEYKRHRNADIHVYIAFFSHVVKVVGISSLIRYLWNESYPIIVH